MLVTLLWMYALTQLVHHPLHRLLFLALCHPSVYQSLAVAYITLRVSTFVLSRCKTSGECLCCCEEKRLVTFACGHTPCCLQCYGKLQSKSKCMLCNQVDKEAERVLTYPKLLSALQYATTRFSYSAALFTIYDVVVKFTRRY